MATCGHCKATGQTIDHVRTCGQAGSAVATKQLPDLAPGNVVTLGKADNYWVITDVSGSAPHTYTAEQSLPGNKRGAWAYVHASEVELVFPTVGAAAEYDLALRTEARLRRNREILHGDPNYCRGCAKGWAGAKWHRDGCPNTSVAQPAAATSQGSENQDSPWSQVNTLRDQVKPHLHRKVRNAQVGHFALRAPADEGGAVKFYRVKMMTGGNWSGKVFVDAQASDDFWPVRAPAALEWILGGIVADPQSAATLYGTELGQCYRCNRTLTDETSRALGIGPECRSK